GQSAGSAGRKMGRNLVRVWIAECVAIRGVDFATVDRACDLRGPRIRGRDRQQVAGSADLLLALYDPDRGGGWDRVVAARAAVEDPDFLASRERILAAGGTDLYSVVSEPAGPDGRICEHGDVQRGGVDHGHRDDRPDTGFDVYVVVYR